MRSDGWLEEPVGWRLSLPLAIAFAVTLSCGGDTTAPAPPPPPPTRQPATVSVTPAQVRLTVGDSARLAAEVRDQNGQAMASATVRWTSGNAAAASVTSAGLVRGISAGSATIAATAGQASGAAEITVSPAAPHPDRAALVALYHATGGPDWDQKTNWLTDEPLGQWHGVTTDSAGSVARLALSGNGLAGTLPPELGDLSNLGRLDLGNNQLAGPIPPELGALANLANLDLNGNRLSGTIPSELGNLANLKVLELGDNELAGHIPATLLRLDKLVAFNFGDSGLCAPGTAAFVAWLSSISTATRDYCSRQDRAALEALYGSAGGADWGSSDGWLAEGPVLDDWHGISADSIGRVAGIDLAGNGLAGLLPAELGQLTELRELRIGDNPQLTGSLPPSLASLALTELDYAGTALCSVDTQSFRDWLATIASHEGTGRECSYGRYVLEALYRSAGAAGWANSANWLTDEPVGEWHGVTTDSSGSVIGLDLSGNGLAGTLPPELGDLSSLERLDVGNNQLSGPIPAALLRLDKLEFFNFDDNAGLCAPGTAAFVAWLTGMSTTAGDYCNRQDMVALETLYRFTGGTNWDNSSGWRDGPALGEWHGIGADSLGRTVRIDLDDNGLAGRLPAELGRLTELRELRVGDNPQLTGPLPPSLTSLSLTDLRYAGTGLCSMNTQAFRIWLATIASHEGTGRECAYTERDALEILYYATGGDDWTNNTNWLTDAPVSSWHGVVGTDRGGSVTWLNLLSNGLTGTLPPELGNLRRLRRLSIYGNRELSGPIPPELGNLGNLEDLTLFDNQLTGTIPSELGNLANLESLNLGLNQLSGPIPPELGNLANLQRLHLHWNQLSGPIPPELFNLDLVGLSLDIKPGPFPPNSSTSPT